MCACIPGSTCGYHKYSNWSQDKKDGFNQRRREAYHAKVSQKKRSEPGSFSMSELSPDVAAKTQQIIDEINYPDMNQRIISESVLRSQELPFEKPASSKFKDSTYEGFDSYDSHLIHEWTGNNGSTTEDSVIAQDLLSLIADKEDLSRDKRTLYRRINLPSGIVSQDEIMSWVSKNYPIDSEKALSTGDGPVSATTDFSFASNGNMPGIVFRTNSSRGMDHPNYDYEAEVMLLPDSYKVKGYTWMDDRTLVIDMAEGEDSKEAIEESTIIPNLSSMMGEVISNPSQVNTPQKLDLNNLMGEAPKPATSSETGTGSTSWVEPSTDSRTLLSLAHERSVAARHLPRLSEDDKDIIEEYKSHEHERYNSPTTKNPASPHEREKLRSIVRKIEKDNQPRNLWRGERSHAGASVDDLLGRFTVGESVSWGNRFASTSANPKSANLFTTSSEGETGILIKFEETVKGAAIFTEGEGREMETLVSGESEFTVKSKTKQNIDGKEMWVVTLLDK